jgi:hypothetical protein
MSLDVTTMESNFSLEDVNDDGYKEIFSAIAGGDKAGEGYLIGLDQNGDELFDLDGNVTTYTGFADLNTSIRAGVAIGDLNNNGTKQIISLTRGLEAITTINNKITCHVAQDLNHDGKPDVIWQLLTNRTYVASPIIANVDNSPDGSLEIVTLPCGNSPEHSIQIFDRQGTLLWEFGGGSAYSSLAVADLDGDGDMEIIAGLLDGIYIWHHNGTPFSVNPFYTQGGYSFASSPVICDLNNDGQKEILVSAINTARDTCRVFAINLNRQLLPGWGTYRQDYRNTTLSWSIDVSKELAVGDLDDDGNLEVVAAGYGVVKVWRNNGDLVSTTYLPGVTGESRAPILADIDGNPGIEIILPSEEEGKIYGINMNGVSAPRIPFTGRIAFRRSRSCRCRFG